MKVARNVFGKRGAVIGTCILHNYCINARIEWTNELSRSIGSLGVVPGVQLFASS